MISNRRARRRGRVKKRASRPSSGWLFVGAGILLATVVVLITLVLGGGGGLREGDTAPDFTLGAADGRQVALKELLQGHEAVVLVFYRGFF